MHPDSSTREIVLADGRVAVVDAADYEMLSSFRWYTKPGRKTTYVVRDNCLHGGSKKKTTGWMHRYILLPDPDIEVDHVDGNGLNNTRANLRMCEDGENVRNQDKHANNTSGYKGVTWAKRHRQWSAQIAAKGHVTWLGYYRTPEFAAHAYDAAALRLFGTFARLNFPLDDGGI